MHLEVGGDNSSGAGKWNLKNLMLNRNYLSQILVKGFYLQKSSTENSKGHFNVPVMLHF